MKRETRSKLAYEIVAISNAVSYAVTGDGDCDTNCAIVGGIVALYAGLDSIPADWRSARERFDFEVRR